MRINLSIINPFSSKYHCMREFKENLSGRQQVAAVAAAIFASIIPVLGSTAAFRKVVKHYHREIPQEWQDPDFIKIPPAGNLAVDPNILVRKLLRVGVTPDNIRFTRVWTALYSPGNNNNMIGGFERCVYGSPEDVELHDGIDLSQNLHLYVAFDNDLAEAKRRIKKPYAQVLTFEQAFGKEALPKAFVGFIRK